MFFCAFLSEPHGSNLHKHSTHLKFRSFVHSHVRPNVHIKCVCVCVFVLQMMLCTDTSATYTNARVCKRPPARARILALALALKCVHVLHYGYIKIFHRNTQLYISLIFECFFFQEVLQHKETNFWLYCNTKKNRTFKYWKILLSNQTFLLPEQKMCETTCAQTHISISHDHTV